MAPLLGVSAKNEGQDGILNREERERRVHAHVYSLRYNISEPSECSTEDGMKISIGAQDQVLVTEKEPFLPQ
jgi:hypothetical protein